jgi:hypothetical protein
MDNRKYILEPYAGMKTRHTCPQCGKPKVFSRYINMETGEYLSDGVGRCNRENKCGYHYTPRQYFGETGNFFDEVSDVSSLRKSVSLRKQGGNAVSQYSKGLEPEFPRFPVLRERKQETLKTEPSFLDPSIFRQSLTGYDKNTFVQGLIKRLGAEKTLIAVDKYRIGTSRYRFKRFDYISQEGATIFYQIDLDGNIVAGKIMLYGDDLHRVKEPFDHITWVHKVLRIDGSCLKQGLFGAHLLPSNTLPVCIVEAEKTAIIASIYLPDFIWLACGQKHGLSAEKCKVLAGRTVILYPDLGAFDLWSRKAKELEAQIPETRFAVSDLLERKASEQDKGNGLDLADYLTRSIPLRAVTPKQTDRWVILNRLLNQGREDCLLVSEGKITPVEWDERCDSIMEQLRAEGIDPKEFRRAVNW